MSRTYRKRKYTFLQQVEMMPILLEFSEQKLCCKLGKYYSDSYTFNIEEMPHWQSEYFDFNYEEHKNYNDRRSTKRRREDKKEILLGLDLLEFEEYLPNLVDDANSYEWEYWLDGWKYDEYFAKDYGRYYKTKSKKFQSNMFDYSNYLREQELTERYDAEMEYYNSTCNESFIYYGYYDEEFY